MPEERGKGLWDFLEMGPAPAPAHPVSATPGSGPVRTYVQGFDDALAGGIPSGSVVALMGGPGTMKSLFAFWTLFQNAKREGIKGIYLTLEQGTGSFHRQMKVLGVDLDGVEDKLALVDVAVLRRHGFDDRVDWVDFILQVARRGRDQGAKLLVIDSLQSLEALIRLPNPRHDKFRFFQSLRDLGLTVFVINERHPNSSGDRGVRPLVEYLADGILEFRFHPIAEYEFQRRIRCLKMRGCRHETSFLALLWDGGLLRVARAISNQEDQGGLGQRT